MSKRTRAKRRNSSKSTLEGNHRFPPFYACYLLKSVRTPRSSATYIGSTPNPPRRLRQHNGELTAGAHKTSRNRPWVMQMIVHGFPSKLAALQFEWAWQHPHVSRHFRDAREETRGGMRVFGMGSRRSGVNGTLKGNIVTVRAMLRMHPYTTWPLHVKLFTPEAVRLWITADSSTPPIKNSRAKFMSEETTDLTANMPLGFTASVELEGVDGKSELQPATGRKGPIVVTDAQFTSSHLAKHTTLLVRANTPTCSICKGSLPLPLTERAIPAMEDQLSYALCPAPDCSAISHLTCLARKFLREEIGGTSQLIPRGGVCMACSNYVLWGDIVRGCYRRWGGIRQDVAAQEDQEKQMDDERLEEIGEEEDGGSLMKASSSKAKGKGRVKPTAGPITLAKKRCTTTKGKGKATAGTNSRMTRTRIQEDEGEFFDLDVSGSESESSEGNPRPVRLISGIGERLIGQPAMTKDRNVALPSVYMRPRTTLSMPVPPNDHPKEVSPSGSRMHAEMPPEAYIPPNGRLKGTGPPHLVPELGSHLESGGEFFDLNVISSCDEESDEAYTLPLGVVSHAQDSARHALSGAKEKNTFLLKDGERHLMQASHARKASNVAMPSRQDSGERPTDGPCSVTRGVLSSKHVHGEGTVELDILTDTSEDDNAQVEFRKPVPKSRESAHARRVGVLPTQERSVRSVLSLMNDDISDSSQDSDSASRSYLRSATREHGLVRTLSSLSLISSPMSSNLGGRDNDVIILSD